MWKEIFRIKYRGILLIDVTQGIRNLGQLKDFQNTILCDLHVCVDCSLAHKIKTNSLNFLLSVTNPSVYAQVCVLTHCLLTWQGQSKESTVSCFLFLIQEG